MRSTPRSRSVDSTCTRAERTLRTGTDCALARARARARTGCARPRLCRTSVSPSGRNRHRGASSALDSARSRPWCGRVRPLLQPDEPRGPAHDGERAEPGEPRVEGCRNDPLAGTAGAAGVGTTSCAPRTGGNGGSVRRDVQRRPARGGWGTGWLGGWAEAGWGAARRAETAAGGGETCREGPLAVTGDRRSSNGRKRRLGAPRRAEEARSRWLGDRVAGARRTGGNGGSVRRDEQRRPARGDRVTSARRAGGNGGSVRREVQKRPARLARAGRRWRTCTSGAARGARVRRGGGWGPTPGQRVGPRAARRLTASDRTSRRLQNAKRTSDR